MMVTHPDGMRAVNDACGVNAVRKKEKTPCDYSCFIFPQTEECNRVNSGGWRESHTK